MPFTITLPSPYHHPIIDWNSAYYAEKVTGDGKFYNKLFLIQRACL